MWKLGILGLALALLGGCIRTDPVDPSCTCSCDAATTDAAVADAAPLDLLPSDGPTPDAIQILDVTLPDILLPADAQVNHYLRFGAKDQFVRLDNVLDWGKDFSVALRIRLPSEPAAFNDYLTCFDWDPVSSTLSGWELGFIAGAKPRWFVVHQDVDPWPKKCDKAAAQSLPLNTWVRVTFVFDYTSSAMAQLKLYINGQVWLDSGSSGTGCTNAIGPQPAMAFRLGGMDGVMLDADDLLVFGRALTAAEVAALNSGTIPSGAALHWKMNEGSGTTVHDASGNGRTGTVYKPNWQVY